MTKRMYRMVKWIILIAVLSACNPQVVDSIITESDSPTDENSQGVQITSSATEVLPPAEEGVTMRVLWTISGYVLGTNFNGDENIAKEMLFKELDINDTQIVFDGQTCDNVSFEKNTVNTADYLANTWKETSKALGIGLDEVEVVKTNCPLFGFQEYMRLDDGQLVVPFNDVFYFFTPVRN